MQPAYRPEIDGLRAVAVLAVIVFHGFPNLLPGGFVGVDVFFVISGYLITGIIVPRISAGTFSFREFYGRRVRRLFPALTLVLVASLLLGMVVLMPSGLRNLAYHVVAGAFFVPNLAYWAEVGYFNPAAHMKPLLHLWSLGVEEQFYLIWPFVLMAATRSKHRLAILCAVCALSFAHSAILTYSNPAAAFYSPVSRLWELALGGILAIVPLHGPRFFQPAGVALIAAASLLLSEATNFPGFAALLPTIGAVMVITGRGGGLLSAKTFVWIGLISYPLYLWHWPLLSFAAYLGIDTALNRSALLLISVALAWITYLYVETPIRKQTLKLRPLQLAGALLLVGAASFALFVSDGLPGRFPAALQKVVAAESFDYRTGTRFGECWLTNEDRFDSGCANGRIFIWGDSHAALLATGFDNAASMTRSSCPPLTGPYDNPCLLSNERVLSVIERAVPDTLILFAAWPNYAHDWSNGWPLPSSLSEPIARAKRAGVRRIVIVGPAPQWERHLPYILFQRWWSTGEVPSRLAPKSLPYMEIERQLKDIATETGVEYASLFDMLCSAGGCRTLTDDGWPIAYDPAHLSPHGARMVARYLKLSGKPESRQDAELIKPYSARWSG